MEINAAITLLRNICINTANQKIEQDMSLLVEGIPNINREQSQKIIDLCEYIKTEASYTSFEISDLMKNIGVSSFKVTEQDQTSISCLCKWKNKQLKVKLMHPTYRYVIGGGPWKVAPITYTETSQKEAKKFQSMLNLDYPYKQINIEVSDYIL